MEALEIILTTACNLRCEYCYQDRKPRRFVAEDTLRRAVSLLLGAGRREVRLVLQGGEPLLAFRLLRTAVELAAAARGTTRVRFETSTNGLLLDDARASFLERHGVLTQVSFDGLPAAQDRRQPGSFALLDRRLRELRRDRPAFFEECLEVAVTVTGANLGVLADSVDYLLALGVPTIHLAPAMPPDPSWAKESPAEMRRQLVRVCRASRRHLERTGRVPVAFLREERRSPGTGPGAVCGIASGRALTVDVSGEIRGCAPCVASYQSFDTPGLSDWVAPLVVADVRTPDLAAALRAFRARVRRNPLFGPRAARHSGARRCARCPFLADCFVCPVATARIPGNRDPRRVPEAHCLFTRATLLHAGHFPARSTAASSVGAGLGS